MSCLPHTLPRHHPLFKPKRIFLAGENTFDTNNFLFCVTCVKGEVQTTFRPDSLAIVWSSYEKMAIDVISYLALCKSLFQVLAVSDIVVYRTRAERLHNDMFQFLSNASGAYLKHFTPELRALSSRCGLDVPLSSLGPAVIVFQETTHTQLLGQGMVGKYIKWHVNILCDHTNTILFTGFILMGVNILFSGFCLPTKMSCLSVPCRF